MSALQQTGVPLHVAVVGPIATEHLHSLLHDVPRDTPAGYTGAPLTAVLIGALLREGHTVSAFTTDAAALPGSRIMRLRGPRLSLTICPSRSRAWRFNGRRPGRIVNLFADERATLASAIRAAQPDVVHAHWTYEFALAAIDTGLPHVVTCHDSPAAVLGYTRSPYRALRYVMALQALKSSRRLTAVSSYMAQEVRRHAAVPIRVIANPLADHVLERTAARTVAATRRIAMVCNAWDRRKNPQPALQAFALYQRHEPAAELHLYGQPFGADGVAQRWARERGLDAGVLFHGVIPHRELIRQLGQADALLHPSREESFGVVLAEAMALGLPIVAGSDSGAVPWVVGADQRHSAICAAVLTDVCSAPALARALEEVFDSRYGQRSAAGQLRAVTLFAPEPITRAYLEEYHAAMNPPLRQSGHALIETA